MTKKKKLPTYMEFHRSIIQHDDHSSVETKNYSIDAFMKWDKKYEEIGTKHLSGENGVVVG